MFGVLSGVEKILLKKDPKYPYRDPKVINFENTLYDHLRKIDRRGRRRRVQSTADWVTFQELLKEAIKPMFDKKKFRQEMVLDLQELAKKMGPKFCTTKEVKITLLLIGYEENNRSDRISNLILQIKESTIEFETQPIQ